MESAAASILLMVGLVIAVGILLILLVRSNKKLKNNSAETNKSGYIQGTTDEEKLIKKQENLNAFVFLKTKLKYLMNYIQTLILIIFIQIQ